MLVKTVRCPSRGRALIKTERRQRDEGGVDQDGTMSKPGESIGQDGTSPARRGHVGQDGTLSKPGESVDQDGTSPARRGRCWSRRYFVQAGGER